MTRMRSLVRLQYLPPFWLTRYSIIIEKMRRVTPSPGAGHIHRGIPIAIPVDNKRKPEPTRGLDEVELISISSRKRNPSLHGRKEDRTPSFHAHQM